MAQIDYYFSVISSYTYLAGTRLEEIAAPHGARIVYRPLDLIQLFVRTGGAPPAERHPNRQAYRAQDLPRIARMRGMPINPLPRHWPVNPAPSAYAVIAAQEAGGDVAGLITRLAGACWVEERDTADDAVIRDCLIGAGFDPGLADRGLLSAAETYAANLDRAVAAGAFGAPFYITDDDARFWGQDRLDHLDWHLAQRHSGQDA